ncbi:MAG: tyrosine-protein phosphatase [Candidatus Dormibacteraceae bacterium]
MHQAVTRRLDWPNCQNTRDLGGLPRPGGVTRMGVLVRSDNLANLTPAGRRAMIDYGVTTVIDLRAESELKGAPGPPFSDFQSIGSIASLQTGAESNMPVYLHLALVDDETASVLNKAATMPDRYRLMIDRRQAALGTIFNSIARTDGPVLFHCFAGKDRTGLVAAMMLSLAGVEADAIGADYAETDAQLATRYAEWLARAAPDRLEEMRAELRCPPEWMLRTLEYVEQAWGGVESYLEAAGVAPTNIDRLSAKLA